MDARDNWFKHRQYLPAFMRDFHAGKDLFKALDDWRHRRYAKEGQQLGTWLKPMEQDMYYTDWVKGHIFVMDHFLPFMAAHGYVLQRTRRKFEFADITVTVADFLKRQADSFMALLDSRVGRESQNS